VHRQRASGAVSISWRRRPCKEGPVHGKRIWVELRFTMPLRIANKPIACREVSGSSDQLRTRSSSHQRIAVNAVAAAMLATCFAEFCLANRHRVR
jgi:hypothetical protein